jgi:uncharacterized protein (DUF4213/DUF364 family)
MASLEKEVQKAVIAWVEDIAYISTNSIPVRSWDDVTDEMTQRQVIVNVGIVSRMPGIKQLKDFNIDVIACNHQVADEEGLLLDTLYKEISSIEDTTIALLQTKLGNSSRITFSGILQADARDAEPPDGFKTKTSSIDIASVISIISPTT